MFFLRDTLAFLLLCLNMMDQKRISRRAFLLGFTCVGVCEAATPLIDLNQKGPSLINISRNRGFFTNFDDELFGDQKGLYFDPEPDLLSHPINNHRITADYQYKPRQNFNLLLINANTGEKLKKQIRVASLNYGIDYRRLDYFLRDWRENKVIQMNRQVIDILLKISERSLGSGESLTVHVTSGYRTRKTNSYLRSISKNVARNSLHIGGKAIDFAISGVSNSKLNNIAKEHAVGGLGVYNNFVHIDSGPFRRWSS